MNPPHNVQADVSLDRIHKAYVTALRYRCYPIAAH
jgi:hypothetical protein